MPSITIERVPPVVIKKMPARVVIGSVVAACLLVLSGCTGVAPSKTVKGAQTGAIAGAVGGAVIGNNTGSGNAMSGAAIGGVAGAVVGGVVGAVQEARERTEQDRLAQERAYQQELAKRRAQDAKFRAAIDEELAVMEGFRISEVEISQVETKAQSLEARLKALQEERQDALRRKRALDTAQGRISAAEQEIQRLEAELADLRGDTRVDPAPASFVEHRVAYGETLAAIATRYQVSAAEIRALNTIEDPNNLPAGAVLRIPGTPAARAASASANK